MVAQINTQKIQVRATGGDEVPVYLGSTVEDFGWDKWSKEEVKKELRNHPYRVISPEEYFGVEEDLERAKQISNKWAIIEETKEEDGFEWTEYVLIPVRVGE